MLGDVLDQFVLCILRVKLGQEVQHNGFVFRHVMIKDLSKTLYYCISLGNILFSLIMQGNKDHVPSPTWHSALLLLLHLTVRAPVYSTRFFCLSIGGCMQYFHTAECHFGHSSGGFRVTERHVVISVFCFREAVIPFTFLSILSQATVSLTINCRPKNQVSLNPMVLQTRSKRSLPFHLTCEGKE